ncbi:hypothetical protein [Acetivibrio clariflavus]|uniref:Uncharacterized protein n=1 Tax=Acetivibrio clariflavus (strain DSM 19732 / NBRC 101661 / EBR45) TaxID=720554 RepID=G8LSD1_ACECE|nr:hypothetical protein [Acetivibrio clariflavus]AEV67192.1 hypothetical protein Clocl_0468 [Acetivibrio clariflavus DSM 19732]HOQ00943.1 hypothetical protein [Acetivibrio clariflavus]HPU41349.1 hypothetical protein [Acetivibrio clariflavus]
MKKTKLFKILILSAISFFALINITWFSITYIKYKPYVDVIPKNSYGFHVFTDENGYNYNVKKPNYLSLTGNLGVTNKTNEFALIIWPKIFGKYIYGVRIQQEEVVYSIYVDENLKPIYSGNEEIKNIINKYKPELEILYNNAKKKWNL